MIFLLEMCNKRYDTFFPQGKKFILVFNTTFVVISISSNGNHAYSLIFLYSGLPSTDIYCEKLQFDHPCKQAKRSLLEKRYFPDSSEYVFLTTQLT